VNAERHEAALQRARAAEIRRRIGDALAALKLPPPAAAERLSETLARARAIARRNADLLTERQLQKSSRLTAEAALTRARAAAAKSDQALLDWDGQWRAAMAALRLDPSGERAGGDRAPRTVRPARPGACRAGARQSRAGGGAGADRRLRSPARAGLGTAAENAARRRWAAR
jgi:hypothetical protein